MELLLVPNDVGLNNVRMELILDVAELNNIGLVPNYAELKFSDVVDIGHKRCRIK